MLQKTFHVTLNVLVALTVWGAALMFAVVIAVVTLQILAISGLTVYHLVHN